MRRVALAACALPVVGLVAIGLALDALDSDGIAASVTTSPHNAGTPPPTPPSDAPPTITAAPAAPTAAPVTTTHSIIVGGRKREWVQTTPAGGVTATTRILVVLHGRAVTPQQEAQRDGFLPLVVSDNLELVYPAGIGASWNAGTCCGTASESGVDDVAFLTELVKAIDPQHAHSITMVGYSNGGRMAYTMACQSPSGIDGFAIVGALPMPTCTVTRSLTLLQVAGTADVAVPFANVTDQVAALRSLDGTEPTPATWQSGTLTVSTWTSSSTRTRIGLAAYQDGTHAWPSGDPTTPGAAEVILRFFSTGDVHSVSRAS